MAALRSTVITITLTQGSVKPTSKGSGRQKNRLTYRIFQTPVMKFWQCGLNDLSHSSHARRFTDLVFAATIFNCRNYRNDERYNYSKRRRVDYRTQDAEYFNGNRNYAACYEGGYLRIRAEPALRARSGSNLPSRPCTTIALNF